MSVGFSNETVKDAVLSLSMDGGSGWGRIRVYAELPTYLLQKNQTIVVQFKVLKSNQREDRRE